MFTFWGGIKTEALSQSDVISTDSNKLEVISFYGWKAGKVVSLYFEIKTKQEISLWSGISFIKNPYRPGNFFGSANLHDSGPGFVQIDNAGQIAFPSVVASGTYIRIGATYVTKNS